MHSIMEHKFFIKFSLLQKEVVLSIERRGPILCNSMKQKLANTGYGPTSIIQPLLACKYIVPTYIINVQFIENPWLRLGVTAQLTCLEITSRSARLGPTFALALMSIELLYTGKFPIAELATKQGI